MDVFAVEAFNQRWAGLTLALLGGNDEEPNRRLIVQAIPVPMNAALPSGELPIGPGEEVIATEGD